MLTEVDKALVRMGAYVATLEKKIVEQAKEIEAHVKHINELVDRETASQASVNPTVGVEAPAKSE